MKHFLTAFVFALISTAAVAEVINAPSTAASNRVIYNLNPLPPIVSNNRVQYPAGTAYVDRFGRPQTCNGPLIIDNTGAQTRIICNQPDSTVTTNPPIAANDLADLAPAAGEPVSTSLFRDSNLSSDRKIGLRSDKSTPRGGY
jgi:hypothetical protein